MARIVADLTHERDGLLSYLRACRRHMKKHEGDYPRSLMMALGMVLDGRRNDGLADAADLLDRLEGEPVAWMVRYEPCGCEIPCRGRVGPEYACPKSGHEDSYATTNTPLDRRTHQTPEEGEGG